MILRVIDVRFGCPQHALRRFIEHDPHHLVAAL